MTVILWICFFKSNKTVFHAAQYNPDYYSERKLIPPSLEIDKLCIEPHGMVVKMNSNAKDKVEIPNDKD